METYHRNIVYHRLFRDDIFRPFVSFPTLRDAVEFYDERIEKGCNQEMKIIDLEHIDMGDMLVHSEAEELIAVLRTQIRTERKD